MKIEINDTRFKKVELTFWDLVIGDFFVWKADFNRGQSCVAQKVAKDKYFYQNKGLLVDAREKNEDPVLLLTNVSLTADIKD